jgi:uncharacterized protein YndB with AHSA1/START domain
MNSAARPPRMISVKRRIAVSPERVFAELTDAWMIPVWLVGAAHIRDVDESWPVVGARLHHCVGPWPVSVSDSTEIIEIDPPRHLVFQARMWPIGEALVDLTVEPDGDGALVTMSEGAARGPARLVDNPLQRWALRKRNEESLARLATVAEKRPSAATAQSNQ